jgi:hypothetical protein
MFLAPFGTPFVGDDATDEIRELLQPEKIEEFGFFDAKKVRRFVGCIEGLKEEIATDRADNFRLNRHVVERTVLGMAMNFVVTTQMLEDLVRRGEFCRYAGLGAEAGVPVSGMREAGA